MDKKHLKSLMDIPSPYTQEELEKQVCEEKEYEEKIKIEWREGILKALEKNEGILKKKKENFTKEQKEEFISQILELVFDRMFYILAESETNEAWSTPIYRSSI